MAGWEDCVLVFDQHAIPLKGDQWILRELTSFTVAFEQLNFHNPLEFEAQNNIQHRTSEQKSMNSVQQIFGIIE